MRLRPRRSAALCVSALAALLAPAAARAGDLAGFVDPLIGTYAPGFVNPGPVLPHGMVGLGPDTEGPLNYGGYYIHNTMITGFSHVHMSAGVPQGGQVPLMPVTGEVRLGDLPLRDEGPLGELVANPVPAYASPFSHAAEVAEAGYYAVDLLRYGVRAELTATERAGMHRYTFPAGVPAAVVVHASRDLKGYHLAAVDIVDDRTVVGEITTSDPGHTIHFGARFDPPFSSSQTFSETSLSDASQASGERIGAILRFGGNGGVVQAKVGISYVDREGALRNVDTEVPGFDFDGVRDDARSAWNDALGKIEVEGGTLADRRSFYTALYHAQLFPNLFSDVDGRRRGFDDVVRVSDRPHYTQFSLWDSYRGQNQLLAVLSPARYRHMIESLLEDARESPSGHLPRWALANRAPNYMSGDPAIPFVGEGWCRGLLDDGAKTELFEAMETLAGDRSDRYLVGGYEPVPKPANVLEILEGGPRQAGTTLEYGIAEFALALMADSDGRSASRDELLRRSVGYRALLDPDTRWIRPRHDDGSWLEPFLPENGYGFQEGTSWQYSWLAMHDLRGLFDGMGGDAAVQTRLDVFFGFPATATVPILWPKLQNQATVFGIEYRGNQYAPGNEHDLHAPFLYAYAGAPWKTQAIARGVASIFTPTPDGLPGNDDLGALSGWLVWTMLGLYPMTPGAPLYVIASPFFSHAVIHGGSGDLVIAAPEASSPRKFVNAAKLGGEDLDRVWITEAELRARSPLSLETSPAPNPGWASGEDARPPSLTTHALADFGCVP